MQGGVETDNPTGRWRTPAGLANHAAGRMAQDVPLPEAVVEGGLTDEVRLVIGELTAQRPDLSLSFLPEKHLYTPNETFDNYLEGIRKAGVV